MVDSGDTACVIVAGPTGSGKSALALALAEAFAGTIINADSQQVYRDLAILTARPSAAEMARVPHRLYGTIDAGESCSVGQWRALALAEIAAARAAGRLPILVGGTGLYIEALLRGLAAVPDIPDSLRQAVRALHVERGGAGFHALLAARDPVAAARLLPSDTQRLIRAYEVVLATGRTLSDWQALQPPPPLLRAAAVVLLPPRAALYEACDRRFRTMVAGGAVAEVQALLARRLSPALPAMKAVGVPALAEFLAGHCTLEAAIDAAQQMTRRYVKRQFTWFRHRLAETGRLQRLSMEAQFSESMEPEIFSFIRQFLLTVPT